MSSTEFASLVGINRITLYYRETDQKPWLLPEITRIVDIMKENGIDDELTVSQNDTIFRICITKD